MKVLSQVKTRFGMFLLNYLGVLLTRAVHAVAASVIVITIEPAISLEFEDTFARVFAEFTGSVTLVTLVMGVAITIQIQLECALVT